MKKLLLVFTLCMLVSTGVFAGNCDHSWQSASDGSSCGARAADMRPGGR